jgi:hypothetical protein
MPIDWATVAARLGGARIYWLAIVDRTGAPRTFPSWGVVVSDALHFYVDGATGTALDLRRNPRIAINLEGGENVVLLRGTANPVGGPAELPEIVAAFAAKYDNRDDARFPNATPEPADCIYMVTPTWALFTEDTASTAAHRLRRFERDPRVRIWKPREMSDTKPFQPYEAL